MCPCDCCQESGLGGERRDVQPWGVLSQPTLDATWASSCCDKYAPLPSDSAWVTVFLGDLGEGCCVLLNIHFLHVLSGIMLGREDGKYSCVILVDL